MTPVIDPVSSVVRTARAEGGIESLGSTPSSFCRSALRWERGVGGVKESLNVHPQIQAVFTDVLYDSIWNQIPRRFALSYACTTVG